jgi:hypothetical protein
MYLRMRSFYLVLVPALLVRNLQTTSGFFFPALVVFAGDEYMLFHDSRF